MIEVISSKFKLGNRIRQWERWQPNQPFSYRIWKATCQKQCSRYNIYSPRYLVTSWSGRVQDISEDWCLSHKHPAWSALQETDFSFLCVLAKMSAIYLEKRWSPLIAMSIKSSNFNVNVLLYLFCPLGYVMIALQILNHQYTSVSLSIKCKKCQNQGSCHIIITKNCISYVTYN